MVGSDCYIRTNKDKILAGSGHVYIFEGLLVTRENDVPRETKVAVKRVVITEEQATQREADCLLRLRHPNIVQLFHIEEDANFKYFALELCRATLRDFCIKEDEGPMPSEETVLLHIALGLDYIHSEGFAHRNIEPKNILISKTIPVVIKIADFGLIKPIQGSQGSFSVSGDKGVVFWKSPEMLDDALDEGFSEKRGSAASDTFSAGCVFFYFMSGFHPFGSNEKIASNVKNYNPVNLTKSFNTSESNGEQRYITIRQEVIEKMIKKIPRERIQLKDVIVILQKIVGSNHPDLKFEEDQFFEEGQHDYLA